MANKSRNEAPRTSKSNTKTGKGSCSRTRSSKDGKYNKYTEPGSNDVSWYSANQTLLRDSASIPFSWAVGSPLTLHNFIDEMSDSKGYLTVPGICALYIRPSVGLAETGDAPINVASNALYTYVRHANSGHSNYDAPDLMIYILAMSSVYSYIVYLQRLYGISSLYAQKNRYMPDSLLRAQGVDPSSIRNNMANFRYGINVLIQKAASFAVPANFAIFNREAFLYQNIYSEGTSMKDQLYMMVPDGFWKFKLSSSNIGMLEFSELPSDRLENPWDVDQLLDYGNQLLTPLLYSEDINIMSGDILKAYGSNIVKLTTLDENFSVVPVYNHSVLEQIKNATVSPKGSKLFNWDITQKPEVNGGYLVHRPQLGIYNAEGDSKYSARAQVYSLKYMAEDRILSTTEDVPGPDVVMENTRLMYNFTEYGVPEGTRSYGVITCGTEVVAAARYFYIKCNDGVSDLTLTYRTLGYTEVIAVVPESDEDKSEMSKRIEELTIVSAFKYHPYYRPMVVRPGSASPAFQAASSLLPSFDVDNYAVVSTQELGNMHYAALLNLFSVPLMGRL